MKLKVQKLVILVFTTLMMTSVAYTGHASFNTEIKTIEKEQDFFPTPDELFKMDPTNPTQILKAERLYNQQESQSDNNIPVKMNVKADTVGDVKDFWTIESFSSYPYNYIQITATLLAVGDNSYVYVANSIISSEGEANARAKAEDYRDEFDNNIYPSDTLYFGNPSGYLGDIDGDPKVTILLLSLDGGVAGYFDPINEYVDANSNQREMVYINYDISDIDYSYAVLTHEFQHLIHFNYDQDELWFVDEGCSEFATYAAGYWANNNNVTYFAEDYFTAHPEDSLLYWNYNSDGGYDVRIDYGGAYMFIFYLAEKYGFSLIETLVAETSNGAQGVEDALITEGISLTFNELYLNWVTALTIDNTTIDDGLYGFVNLDIAINDKDIILDDLDNISNVLHRYYGFHITEINAPIDYLFFEISAPIEYAIGFSIIVYDSEGLHIDQSISEISLDKKIEVIQGNYIEKIYVITSLMEPNTPIISSEEQFGLGPDEYLDIDVNPGNPLFIQGVQTVYSSSSWNYYVSNLHIFDENNTEITNETNINVFLKFKNDRKETLTKSLNYSSTEHWNGNLTLQDLFEGTYQVTLFATNRTFYGAKLLDKITIEHIITVEKPKIKVDDITGSLTISVGASYTQVNGWDEFTNNAEVKAVIYDKSAGTPADVIDLSYDLILNKWVSTYNLSLLDEGEYYVSVTFKYASRTVTSDNSDTFTITIDSSTQPTNPLTSPYLLGVLLIAGFATVYMFNRRK
ncbi:MAG: hypothetical protein ACTSQE_06260 [Candidatus Heimdallarchaeaceae archaeon]